MQVLAGREDLLDDDPGPARGRVQPLEVGLRVGEAVGMVDPEAVDHAAAMEVEQHRVRGVEDVCELDADRDQRVDVEEAPVVQDLVLLAPRRERVVLSGEQVGERCVGVAPGREREAVLEVAQHRLAVVVAPDGELARREDVVERRAEQGQPDAAAAGLPVDVEPVRLRRIAAVPQHLPERRVEVLRLRDRHVVRHDVDDDARGHGRARPPRGRPAPAAPPSASETRLWSTTS